MAIAANSLITIIIFKLDVHNVIITAIGVCCHVRKKTDVVAAATVYLSRTIFSFYKNISFYTEIRCCL